MMWASMIVSSDSRSPSWVNSSSADTPATISGVTSGISIRMLAPPTQRVRARTSPNASSVPRNVPTSIVTVAISMLARSELVSDSLSKKRWYHSNEKPVKRCSERWLLNEKTTTSRIGRNMNTKKSPV